LGVAQRRGLHGPALHGAPLDAVKQGVALRGGVGRQMHVIHRRAVFTRAGHGPAGSQAKVGCRNAQGFQQRAVGDVAGVPVVVIQNMVARVAAVYPDVLVADDLEAPRLRVVTAGRPAGQVEDACQGLTVHGLNYTGTGFEFGFVPCTIRYSVFPLPKFYANHHSI